MGRDGNTAGIETFRATQNAAAILKDAELLQQYGSKTAIINKGIENLKNSPPPQPRMPVSKARNIRIV